MQKAYSRITWHNKPSTQTPLDETNLNKMDLALDTVDDRVIALDTGKANSSDLLTAVKSVVLNPTTGVLTITQMDNTSTTYDTALEKVAVNFDYDDDPTSAHYENLIITLEDGSYKYVDLSALITEYEFENSDTIAPSVVGGKVSMSIRNGSIDNSMLKSSFLVDIRAAQAAAEGAASDASGSATAAAADALLAESHNHGNTGVRDNEDTDNAMYYKNQANILGQAQAKNSEAWANGTRDGQAVPSTDPAYHNNGAYWAGQANALGAAQKLEAQAWAEGMRGTTPVSQGDDQYNNSAKYWAGQAQQAAGGGVTSFNNRTANVVPMAGDYDKTMVGLGNVDNTSDLNKPLSYAMSSALALKTPKSDIAPTEVSPSTHAYKQGDIFYYNGVLYKAKTAIAVDDVLTVGTNIETTTISATSGGHVIVDESGTSLTQRSKLKFTGGVSITDDSIDDETIVNIEGEQIQVTSLPTASADEFGNVYQYLGSTTSSYTHGYFYECVLDGSTYYWKNIPVQDDNVGGVLIDDVSGASVTSSHTTATITWTDPTDLVIDGHTLAEWGGTLVVRKVGSAPTDKNDGTVVVNNTTRNQYSSSGYADTGLSYDTTYYYRFFPYSKQSVYTDGSSVYIVPERESISTTPSESTPLTYTGQVQSASLTGYDSTKMDIADNTAINVGHYLAHVTPKEDYKWSDETSVTITEYIDNVQTKQFTSNGIGNISFDLSSVTDTSSHTGKIVATDGTNSDMIEFTFTKEAS